MNFDMSRLLSLNNTLNFFQYKRKNISMVSIVRSSSSLQEKMFRIIQVQLIVRIRRKKLLIANSSLQKKKNRNNAPVNIIISIFKNFEKMSQWGWKRRINLVTEIISQEIKGQHQNKPILTKKSSVIVKKLNVSNFIVIVSDSTKHVRVAIVWDAITFRFLVKNEIMRYWH